MRIKMNCEVQEQQKQQQQHQYNHHHHHHYQQQQNQQHQQQNTNKLYTRKPQQQQQHQQQECSDDDDEEEESCMTKPEARDCCDLTAAERKNLEFAQKLGYSEQSIHTALTRLGSEAKQNELLAELIKLTPRSTTTNTSANINSSSNNNCNNNNPNANNNNSNNNNSIISNNNNNNNNNHGHCVSNGLSTIAASTLRHIVIDGSNVALSHGNNTLFSCRGIRICVDWFRQRGHRQITAFVPNWRKESARTNMANNNITEQELLYELERERVLVFTPSRHLDGKRMSCYDDRYILKLAAETDGIVVSNDNYRDLLLESNEYRKVVQERLLMYSFVNDRFMPPDDPLGRSGPTLDIFLRSQTQQKMADAQQLCPYGKKCTYGQKCKFRHQPSAVVPLLQQQQRMPLQASHSAPLHSNNGQQLNGSGSGSSCIQSIGGGNTKMAHQLSSREPLGRTKSNTIEKISKQPYEQLCNTFNSSLELGGCEATTDSTQLNRHKKLQRQQAPATSAYRLLVPTYSAPHGATLATTTNYHHQLSRTPSAPPPVTDGGGGGSNPAALALPAHNFAHLSASDSRINEELHLAQTREEKRRLLRYHLSSLFPQHQVHAVLQMFPDETDAKTICAAILNLFPHN